MARKKQTLVVLAAVLATIGIGTDVSVASAQSAAAAQRPAIHVVTASAPATAQTVASAELAAARAVVASINRSRAALGIPALWWGIRVTASAYYHNRAMAAANMLSHQLPGEASLGTRVSRQRVTWTWVGENVGEAPSFTTYDALLLERMMMGDAGHRNNILTRYASVVGVDVYFDTAHHKLWLTEDFAN
jgi:uncharacterized protein YkwD